MTIGRSHAGHWHEICGSKSSVEELSVGAYPLVYRIDNDYPVSKDNRKTAEITIAARGEMIFHGTRADMMLAIAMAMAGDTQFNRVHEAAKECVLVTNNISRIYRLLTEEETGEIRNLAYA